MVRTSSLRLKRALLISCAGIAGAHAATAVPLEISGIHPELAFFNDGKEQTETGVGAIVPYAGKLWVITYSAHNWHGGDDGLFEITPGSAMVRRPESIGGTPANRFIERTTGKLFLGPYVIDPAGAVTALSYKDMPGRYTATCADPFKPGSVLTYTMEEGTHRIDAKTLAHETLFMDGNEPGKYIVEEHMLPGYHGKGAWSSQGVYVVANNGQYPYTQDGPTGCLAEWDGTPAKNTQDVTPWRVIRRNQFTEVTGPGGIHGPIAPGSPIWSLGWDKRSVILACRDAGEWSFRRLPKGSFTYDAPHGWYTEWPRIRDVEGDTADGKGRHLMTMHGQIWDFDPDYRAGHAVAPKPLTAYLKIFGDFAAWKTDGGERIVFGSDDVSVFANPLGRRSQSNLVFVKPDEVAHYGGPTLGWGSVWLDETVRAGEASDAMDVSGYEHATLTLSTRHKEQVFFTVQTDADGSGNWKTLRVIKVAPNGFTQTRLDGLAGWVRVTSSADASGVEAVFQLTGKDTRTAGSDAIFDPLAKAGEPAVGGYAAVQANPGRGFDFGTAGKVVTIDMGTDGFTVADNTAAKAFIRLATPKAEKAYEITPDAVIVREKLSAKAPARLWRLPRHSDANDGTGSSPVRVQREVVTERFLLNIAGTVFELPRSDSDGVAGIRPVASHDFRIADFANWRGLLILSGVRADAKADGVHVFVAGAAGKFWAGSIDDLWRLGKPRGVVMDFSGVDVAANTAGDACLMYGYDRKTLAVSHSGSAPLKLALEINVTGDVDDFHRERTIVVEPGRTVEIPLEGLMARWARVTPLSDAKALKAGFRYE